MSGPRADAHARPLSDPLPERTDDPLADPAPEPPAEDDTIRVRKAQMESAPVETQDANGRFASWAVTHVGTVRKHNEDSLVDRADLGVWAVADGAGGHLRGDVASRMVADALEGLPPNLSAGEVLAEVRQRMTEVNAALRASVAPPQISASTVAVLIARGDHFACLWAGDSRIYLLREGTMTQVTRDHSLVQEMVEAGAIRAEDAETHPNANVITRAVGSGDELDLDKVTDRLLAGDRFLLCSDGLCKTIPDALTAQLLAAPEDPAGKLVHAALEHNSRDNVTAVVVDILT
ncbi:MAG TPA: protein phosphatase 2C domain-containing protein [Rhodopila sp.]|uniref:PP2C family protein-serine/threonine phosphatase n=1 Tax=Rhodopila sp. TaxID=2480087 RepID=UPI002BBA06B1|nr:protein phosphatase 2C domain-containing protein [Rhodopila sp.]HVY17419.1 protein phosphatase 2C domain-containing protein [Rhodopila sp.]